MNAKSILTLSLLTLAVSLGQAAAPANPPVATPPAAPAADASKRAEEAPFGTTREGTANKLFTLRNHKGATLKVMTYGATMQEISMPDKDGKFANCCLSSGATFNQSFGQLAYTVGRVANRIADAKFTLEGKDYTTAGVLHSGTANFGTRLWEGKLLPEKEHETSVEMKMVSKDGDGGYPGNLTLTVTFSLTDDNEVRLDYEGTTDKTTLLAPTNHCYFNLGGNIMDYDLWLDADKYTPGGTGRGANLFPTGEIAPVAGTAFDFTKPAKINSRASGSYDNSIVINNWKPGKNPGGGAGGVVLAGRVSDPVSGRVMEIKTDQPGIQLYTGARTGVAFETQHFPDAIHHDNFPSTVLKPGETFKSSTIYAFSVKK